MSLIDKSNNNKLAAEWAYIDGREYYDVAVSRLYYSLFQNSRF
jgi:uncharacterized protein (UPF0332 family)